jgi:hypothetical protein
VTGPPERIAGSNTDLIVLLREHAAQLAPLLA